MQTQAEAKQWRVRRTRGESRTCLAAAAAAAAAAISLTFFSAAAAAALSSSLFSAPAAAPRIKNMFSNTFLPSFDTTLIHISNTFWFSHDNIPMCLQIHVALLCNSICS
jgi:hypothetical protein